MAYSRHFIFLGLALFAADPVAAQQPAPNASAREGSETKAAPQARPLPAVPPKPSPPPQVGTSAVVVDRPAVESVIGKSVKSYTGEDMGHIVDLLVTPSGQMRAAIIDFGGVLGVGSRKVAVDWGTLNFMTAEKDGAVILALTRDQVRVSPEYKSGDPVVILETAKPKPDAGKPADKKVDAPPSDPSPKTPAATITTGK